MRTKGMFLKIQYGPTSAAYYTDFYKVDFTSHLDGRATAITLDDGLGEDMLFCEESFEEERGCSKHDTKKNTWYVNKVHLTFKHHKDFTDPPVRVIYYTGNAYLCNSEGKTVDILR